MKFVVLLKKSTLHALSEHAVTEMGPVVEINEAEALVMLSDEVITRLITLAKPEDERIDDVIARLAL
ncbi:MAG: hypothetical protein IT430_19790 [Phycisphaerales bacterium]|nr:hypothetical protein [Phycisphaerales bacterium]